MNKAVTRAMNEMLNLEYNKKLTNGLKLLAKQEKAKGYSVNTVERLLRTILEVNFEELFQSRIETESIPSNTKIDSFILNELIKNSICYFSHNERVWWASDIDEMLDEELDEGFSLEG